MMDILSDMDWTKVYAKLGNYFNWNQFYTACTGIWVEGTWAGPMLSGITCDTLVTALRSLGVKVVIGVDGLDTDFQRPERELKNNSYIICIKRSPDAEEWLVDKPLRTRVGGDYMFITPREWLLFELGYYMTAGQHLDRGGVTVCPNYRLHDGSIIGLDYDGVSGAIIIFKYDLDKDDNPSFRPRRVLAFHSQIPSAIFGG